MSVRGGILLAVGLFGATHVRAAGLWKAPSFLSVRDTSRVPSPSSRLSWPYLQLSKAFALRATEATRGSSSRAVACGRLDGPFSAVPQLVAAPVLYGADGNVLGLARSGNTLYIAGSFRSVGENNGGFVPFDARNGQPLGAFPKVAGAVVAMVPDGSGGWYIGGEFSGVGGKPRSCLAQIRADGSVSDWAPSVTGSPGYVDPPTVAALAKCGDRLFVGGAFREMGGHPHENLGCVDLRTGQVLNWNLDTNIGEPVSCFATHEGTLFVAGAFSSIGNTPRSSLAALDVVSGSVLPWQVDLYGGASALLASGDTLYVGGYFTDIGGISRPKLAAVSISNASALPMDFRVDGVWQQYDPLIQVTALAKASDTLYVTGNFTAIGGQARSGLAALNATTGDALSWSPDTTGPRRAGTQPPLCTSVAVLGPSLYVGGYFELVEGTYHPLVAAWDRHTGKVQDWTPNPDDIVAAFGARGDTLCLGGYFHMLGAWKHRAGLAAIDLATGQVKPWNPNPDGSVCTAIAASGSRAFVSGDFTTIGGNLQPRSFFAALDTVNGEATAWDPGANDVAASFMLSGDTLFAGGYFTQVGGQVRNAAAAIDGSTGQVLDWNPNADYPVLAMARAGNSVYLGGIFQQMGGQQRLGLACVDSYTGSLGPWNPGTDNSTVKALLLAGNTLYVGGAFGAIGGIPRNAIAAVDATTGTVTPWYPPPTAWGVPTEVKALALRDGLLYVGGAFASLNGEPRICLAAVDVTNSVVAGWDPGLNGYVWSLFADENILIVGGGFSRAGGIPADDLAAFTAVPAPPTPPSSLVLAPCVPNPVRTIGEIQFGLPTASTVTLSVFDIQGRLIAAPINHLLFDAGSHTVRVQADGWRQGVYLCRLEAGGRSATRKMLVVR